MTLNSILKSGLLGLGVVTAMTSSAMADGYDYSSYSGNYITDGDYSVFNGVIEKDLRFGNNIEVALVGGLEVVSGSFEDTAFIGLASIGYNFGSPVTPYVKLGFFSNDFSRQTTYGVGVDYRGNSLSAALEYRQFDDWFDFRTAQLAAIYAPNPNLKFHFGATSFVDENFELYSIGTSSQFGAFSVDASLLMDEDLFDDALLFSRFEYGFAGGDSLFGPSSLGANDIHVFGSLFGPLDELDNGTYEIGLGFNINNYTRFDISYTDYLGCEGCDADIAFALKYEMGKKRLRVIDEYNDLVNASYPIYSRNSAYQEYYGSLFN